MIEFNEFKKEVCSFYRQNGEELTYFICTNPDWQKCSVEVEFRLENVSILFSYKLSQGYPNKAQRDKKADKLMRELSKDLKSIEKELKE